MKRILAVVVAVCMFLCVSAPFAYAKKEYTAPEYTGTSSEYVTREQAIAGFVKAVGKERFSTDPEILNEFPDKNEVSFACLEEVSAAVYSGLISGYEDGTLRPRSYITRIEALVILNRALSRTELGKWSDTTFTDIPDWATNQVNRLAAAGIVKGYGDGTLGAKDLLTPAQVNTLCERIIRYTGPAGDFYTYVNSPWLERTDLGDGEYVSELARTEEKLNTNIGDIIFHLYRKHYNDGQEYPKQSDEYRIITVYSAAANMGYRDKIGFEPIREKLEMIDGITGRTSLSDAIADLQMCGFSTLFPISADVSLFEAGKYSLSLSGFYTGVPTEYLNNENIEAQYDIYKDYMTKLFALSGDKFPEENAERAAEVCKTIAKAGLKQDGEETQTRTEKVKNLSIDKVKKEYGCIDVNRILKKIGGAKIKNITVYDEDMMYGAASCVKVNDAETIKAVRAYLKASVIDNMVLCLDTTAFEEYKNYRGRLINDDGAYDNSIPADYAVSIVRDVAGWELGRLYIDMYFPESIKDTIEDLTDEIKNEYIDIISKSRRLTEDTKAEEIKKIKSITVNAAFPDDFNKYTDGDFVPRTTEDGGSIPEYKMQKAKNKWEKFAKVLSLGKEAERGNWTVYPYTANAMYDPVANSITIPAGILQAPFFETGATYEENLGGIGFVIAHEISHAFDSVGAEFDENGVIKKRWQQEDYNGFYSVCDTIDKEYDKISVDGTYIDGSRTLNENLADLSAMTCIIKIAERKGADLDKVFCAFAKSWREKASYPYQQYLLSADSHSPARIRVNRVLSNFDEFAQCYGITEGDGMYLPKEQQIDVFKINN